MLSWIFLFAYFLLALFLFFGIIAFITGAPFVPSTTQAARRMIELARIKSGMIVYDLGSGDGRLLLLATQRGALAIGVEINPLLVFYTHVRLLLSPYRNRVRVYWKNFWQANLSDADVVFVYLLPWRMEQLQQFLVSQLKPGAIVVSNSFIFPHWKIIRKNEKDHVFVFRRL